jgi:hypothetical protein
MRGRLLLCAVAVIGALGLVPSAAAANSITANPSSPMVSTGVYFTITGKSTAGRDYVAVEVSCKSGDTVVYSTRIFVTLVDGAGTSQTIYPPESSCAASLEAPQSINKFRVLETISFTVGPG